MFLILEWIGITMAIALKWLLIERAAKHNLQKEHRIILNRMKIEMKSEIKCIKRLTL